jgi:cystathionine beta-lyase family protein involved in aluminum resistance
MLEQSVLINLTSPGIAENTTSQLRQEYQAYQNLFQIQPVLVQQYLIV